MKDNKNTFGHTPTDARGVSLSSEERRQIEGNIRLFMAEHPLRLTFFERLQSRFRMQTGSYRRAGVAFASFRPAIAGLLIVSLTGLGTSYAAADALPGDMLYPIKTNLNENIRT